MRVLLVFAVCVGCGGGSEQKPPAVDGPIEADAAVDGPLDASAGAITVTVFDHYGAQPHLPLAGAMVKFVAPDGSTQTATTDSAGVASAMAQPNTTIMVFQSYELGYPLVKVFVGANPGDEIAVGKYSREAFIDIGDVTFNLPLVTGGQQYRLMVSCSRRIAGSENQVVMRATDCAAHQAATAVGWVEGAGGVVIGGASVMTGLNLAALAGTTVTMPSYGAQTTVTGTMTNVPATATDAAWSAYYYKNNDRMLVALAGSTEQTAAVPVFDVGDRTVSALSFRLPGYVRSYYYENHASKLTTVAVDAAGMVRPFKNAQYHHATNTVTWEEAATGQDPTITSFTVSASRNGISKVYVQIHAPYDSSKTLALPTLPSEIAIAPNDTVYVDGRFESMVGKSYSDMLEIVDTSAVSDRDPGFTGKLWVAW